MSDSVSHTETQSESDSDSESDSVSVADSVTVSLCHSLTVTDCLTDSVTDSLSLILSLSETDSLSQCQVGGNRENDNVYAAYNCAYLYIKLHNVFITGTFVYQLKRLYNSGKQ